MGKTFAEKLAEKQALKNKEVQKIVRKQKEFVPEQKKIVCKQSSKIPKKSVKKEDVRKQKEFVRKQSDISLILLSQCYQLLNQLSKWSRFAGKNTAIGKSIKELEEGVEKHLYGKNKSNTKSTTKI